MVVLPLAWTRTPYAFTAYAKSSSVSDLSTTCLCSECSLMIESMCSNTFLWKYLPFANRQWNSKREIRVAGEDFFFEKLLWVNWGYSFEVQLVHELYQRSDSPFELLRVFYYVSELPAKHRTRESESDALLHQALIRFEVLQKTVRGFQQLGGFVLHSFELRQAAEVFVEPLLERGDRVAVGLVRGRFDAVKTPRWFSVLRLAEESEELHASETSSDKGTCALRGKS